MKTRRRMLRGLRKSKTVETKRESVRCRCSIVTNNLNIVNKVIYLQKFEVFFGSFCCEKAFRCAKHNNLGYIYTGDT